MVLPFAGAGGYSEGGRRHLGGDFEFTIGVTFVYQFKSGDQLGLTFSPISNAGIHEGNPGSESLLVRYSIPVGNLFWRGPMAGTARHSADNRGLPSAADVKSKKDAAGYIWSPRLRRDPRRNSCSNCASRLRSPAAIRSSSGR